MSKNKNIGVSMKIANAGIWCYQHNYKVLSKLFYAINYIVFGCVIPPSVKIGVGTVIAHSIGVVMHHSVVIGKDCHILHNVTLGGNDRGGPMIGDNVMLGAGCCVLGNVRIGNGVKIGANAVVLKDVPDGAVAVGVPARIIMPMSVQNVSN